ncbi:alpha/beta hydrolase [Gilvimarinus agarilyticus]|uniref:alpha/beta fold hydrolase n=1 Tax=Gilvimarinus sp. 2_MG-2023 TaxID=3062666 RepID=UPI001C081825|nr:alpha/beta fold hydrolase [Gilvimarinus sp. 2_MG-2023]MBU2885051.1 alpha/beta hydrolase [Gilvimarinus agarilyticus]MDO6569948.1 alpha/beta fold hydrolase [Gilvimarinus sp. 2_MG-2023]
MSFCRAGCIRIVGLIVLLTGIACSDNRTDANPPNADNYQLHWRTCDSAPESVRCGELILPGALDVLSFRVLRYQGDNKQPEPLMYLQGGPGYRLDFSARGLQAWLSFAEHAGLKRDLILLNRRGSNDQCREYRQARRRTLLLAPERINTGLSADEALIQCLNRSDTLAVTDYGTRQNAADVRALMRLLAVPGWHGLGVSYGTRLAIELAGTAGLQSLVLDSVYPPGMGGVLQSPQLLGQSLDNMAAACRTDAQCLRAWQTHFADISLSSEAFMHQLRISLARLQENPVDVTVTLDGWSETVWVTAPRFLSAAFSAAYNRHRWPRLVAAMAATEHSGRKALSQLMQLNVGPATPGQSTADTVARLAHTAVDCRDNRLGSEQEYQQGLSKVGWLKPYMAGTWQGQICQHWLNAIDPVIWPAPSALAKVPQVTLLAGEFDPITPVSWAEMVSHDWPQVQLSVFPASGHSVLNNRPCALGQLERVLNREQKTIEVCE